MKAGRVALILVGALVGSLAFGLIAAGTGLAWTWSTDRTTDGFFEAPEVVLETDQYAIISPDIDLGSRPGDWFPSGRLADVKISVDQPETQAVFVAIGPATDVDRYLDGVGVAEITGIDGDTVTYRTEDGAAPAGPPADQTFWVATNAGGTTDTLEWSLAQGEWTLVMMNADGAAGIDVGTIGAARVDIVPIVAAGLIVFGAVLGAIAIALLLAGVTVTDRDAQATAGELVPVGAYPVRLEGELDRHLSRGLWLVKWFLAIPHFIVLGFLFIAFAVLTLVAGVSVLFTGKYPRGMFDFNVGVLRWTWRVAYYATSAIGTDRYPPFTLERDDYPATLDIAYPESLSRGLVLVKWLLAIPHLVIVSLFTSGLMSWTEALGTDASAQVGTGLIGLLVIIAGFSLLFTGRYPQSLFDLLMGFNRWVYRVVAYVALMTDDYPPFRLDQGGTEPPAGPGPSRDPSDTHAAVGAGG